LTPAVGRAESASPEEPAAANPDALSTPEEALAPDPANVTAKEGPCDLVCELPRIDASADGTADIAQVTENATEVLEKLQPKMLACYKKRIMAKPQAHAFMMFDLLVGPDGHVKNVSTEGGALLGDQTIDCLVANVKNAAFDPPRGGGTLHIYVPFTLRRVAPGDME
jgi:hypothetical protein